MPSAGGGKGMDVIQPTPGYGLTATMTEQQSAITLTVTAICCQTQPLRTDAPSMQTGRGQLMA